MVLHNQCFSPYDLHVDFLLHCIFLLLLKLSKIIYLVFDCGIHVSCDLECFFFQKVKRQIQAQTEIRDDGKKCELV